MPQRGGGGGDRRDLRNPVQYDAELQNAVMNQFGVTPSLRAQMRRQVNMRRQWRFGLADLPNTPEERLMWNFGLADIPPVQGGVAAILKGEEWEEGPGGPEGPEEPPLDINPEFMPIPPIVTPAEASAMGVEGQIPDPADDPEEGGAESKVDMATTVGGNTSPTFNELMYNNERIVFEEGGATADDMTQFALRMSRLDEARLEADRIAIESGEEPLWQKTYAQMQLLQQNRNNPFSEAFTEKLEEAGDPQPDMYGVYADPEDLS